MGLDPDVSASTWGATTWAFIILALVAGALVLPFTATLAVYAGVVVLGGLGVYYTGRRVHRWLDGRSARSRGGA